MSRSRPSRPKVAALAAAERFGEADLEGDGLIDAPGQCTLSSQDPRSWRPGESDIHELTVPLGEVPAPELPSSITAAILDVLEQVPGAPPSRPAAEPTARKSSPELPEAAYRRRAR